MRTFTDNTGRTWSIAVNVGSIKRVRALTKTDLMAAVEGDLLQKLSVDPILLCDVIYALVKPEADAANVSDEDFGRAMAGDAIDSATTALLEDLVDFFPRDRRLLLTKALEKLKKLQGMAVQAVEVRLDSGVLEAQMEQAMAELDQLGATSTSSPASLGSTPAP